MRVKNYFFLFVVIILSIIVLNVKITSAKSYNWKLVSVWPAGLKNIIAADYKFAETVESMSNGELKIKVFASGELCKSTEVLNMVSSGTVEMGVDWPNYWSGKDTAFDLLGSNSVTFSAEDYLIWDYQHGGIDLAQELYGEYGCIWFPHYMSHMESGIRSNKPINSIDDLKGMKIRLGGLLPGEILKELGATPMTISVAELYEALRRGVLDGAEFSTPSNDQDFHFDEITKYWCTPGWHQTSSQHGVLVNKKSWDSLPEHLKNIVKNAAMATHMWSYTKLAYEDAKSTEFFKSKGIIVTKLSDEDLTKIENIKNKLQVKHSEANPMYKKILQSQIDYLNGIADYREAIVPFSFGRNPKNLPQIQ